jgi:hypothetical protein
MEISIVCTAALGHGSCGAFDSALTEDRAARSEVLEFRSTTAGLATEMAGQTADGIPEVCAFRGRAVVEVGYTRADLPWSRPQSQRATIAPAD